MDIGREPHQAVLAIQRLNMFGPRVRIRAHSRQKGACVLLRIAVPDLISPSYLPAEAIVTLGFLAKEGVLAELELIAPVEAAYAALRDG